MGKDDCNSSIDVLELVPVVLSFLLMSAHSHHLFLRGMETNLERVKWPKHFLQPHTFAVISGSFFFFFLLAGRFLLCPVYGQSPARKSKRWLLGRKDFQEVFCRKSKHVNTLTALSRQCPYTLFIKQIRGQQIFKSRSVW